MTALEAMARGVMVVSLDVGDLNLLIKNKFNGFIADNDEQLPKLLWECLKLPMEQKVTLRENAQRTIELSYSRQAAVRQLIQYYGTSPLTQNTSQI